VVQYHRSGQRLLVAASVKLVFDEDDRPIGRIAVNRDMTRVRELERDVLRVAKLESVAFVAGGVAHDVKNMLSGAMGLAELINRRLSDKPSAKLARQLKQSLREAAALTERMVSYSRKGSLNIESMCLNARLEAIDQLLRRLLPETVELVVERCSDSLPVRFERGQFDQIVMNLVVNARDALPDGGTISISTERVESESDPGVYCAEIAVRDDGCGIDEDTRDQIFEPYFTTKPAGIGSGFGLATVRDIVRRYHGTIEVESEPGEGTTFTLRLPLVPSAQSEITRRG
jgi:signal transduction histidine kinase